MHSLCHSGLWVSLARGHTILINVSQLTVWGIDGLVVCWRGWCLWQFVHSFCASISYKEPYQVRSVCVGAVKGSLQRSSTWCWWFISGERSPYVDIQARWKWSFMNQMKPMYVLATRDTAYKINYKPSGEENNLKQL